MGLSCDLFCRVVDNLGDAGVCWRLARQLAGEYGWSVRLWIDDLEPLAGLKPGIDSAEDEQSADGVVVRRWPAEFPEVAPGDVVIEAFACDLPERFVTAMATRSRAPVWINLEYLATEDWTRDCHGKPSPHPRLPLTKHFFFPGFVSGTGGLIRESDFVVPPATDAAGELRVSLFCYDNPALPDLLGAWAEGSEAITCRVAEGIPRVQVERWLGRNFPAGSIVQRGSLRLLAKPFVAQRDFDARLAASDLNFVRGEDSLVRAQWAERPFVWQLYPQAGDAHLGKLEAFLDRYLSALPKRGRSATADFWRAWNGHGDISACWPAFRGALPDLAMAARPWASSLVTQGNLAENLVRFCEERL